MRVERSLDFDSVTAKMAFGFCVFYQRKCFSKKKLGRSVGYGTMALILGSPGFPNLITQCGRGIISFVLWKLKFQITK